MAIAIRGFGLWIGRTGDVATVLDRVTEARERLDDAGHSQRLRPHAGAPVRGADIGRHADQADAVAFLGVGHGVLR